MVHGSVVLRNATHLRRVIRETIRPYEIEIVLEFLHILKSLFPLCKQCLQPSHLQKQPVANVQRELWVSISEMSGAPL